MSRVTFNMGAIHKLHRICPWFMAFMAMCWWVLMLSDVAGVSNVGVQLVEKSAYIGEASVMLYSIDNDYAEPSLYREPETLIASWNGTTCTVEFMADDYNGKISMDKKRKIWMYDVEIKDAGKYYVKFGAKLERPTVNITLNVKEQLAEEQPEESPNNHPDFTKKGHLTGDQMEKVRELQDVHTKHIKEYVGKQIGQIRELLDEQTKDIKDHVDSWIQPIMILLVIIIGMIAVLCILLAAGNHQIRKGLLGLVKRNLCSQQENENEYRTEEAVIDVEQGHLTGEQIRKLLDDHKRDIKEYIGNLTGQQIGQTNVLEDEQTKHIKEYVVVTKPKIPKLSGKVVALPPRSNSVLTDSQSSTSNDEQISNKKSKMSSAETPESLDSDSNDEQDSLLGDTQNDPNGPSK